MQAEKERATLQDQIDRDRAQADAIAKQNEMQQEMALERLKAEMQMQIDRERQQSKVRFNQWKAELDARTKIEIAEIQAGVAIQNSQATAASQAAKDQKVSEEKNATLGVMQKWLRHYRSEAKGLIKAPEQVWRNFEKKAAIIEKILQIAKFEKMKREEEKVMILLASYL